MTKKIIVFAFIFCSVFSFAQESKVIDSLKIIENENKIRKIIFDEIPKINKGETETILNLYSNAESLILPKLENYRILIQNSKGLIYEQLGNFDKAMKLYKSSFNVAIEIKDEIGKARSLQFMGINCGKRNIPDSTLFYAKKSKELIIRNLKTKDSIKNQNILLNLNNNIASAYFIKRDFDKSVDMNFEIINIAKKLKNKRIEALSHGLIGLCYTKIGNWKNALKHYENELNIAKSINDETVIGISLLHNAQVYVELKKYKNAKECTSNAIEYFKKVNDKKSLNTAYQNLITIYKKTKEFDKIHDIEDDVIKNTSDMKLNLCHLYVDLAEVYLLEKNYSASLKYFNFAEKNIENDISNKKYFLEKKSEYYKSIGDTEKFLKSKGEELKLKEKENSTEFIRSIAEFESKLKVLQKEAKIKEQQLLLEKEKTNRNMALAGIAGLAFLSFGGFWFYRTKQKQKQLQTQNTLLGLQQNLNAMQLENLNKQLDPHEIKNVLANISPEIQRNAPEAYNKMTKLLNLTRVSLSSNSVTDSIENQLQQIEDYLSLEKTVLPVPLQYSIHNTVETNKQIPRLLLKNIVENSIKHGIKNKKEGGEIKVNLSEKENTIFIEIDDTGIGRHQAISLDSGIGTSTYINLFETLNKTNTQKASFNIIDKENGTKVEIYIPTDYKYS